MLRTREDGAAAVCNHRSIQVGAAAVCNPAPTKRQLARPDAVRIRAPSEGLSMGPTAVCCRASSGGRAFAWPARPGLLRGPASRATLWGARATRPSSCCPASARGPDVLVTCRGGGGPDGFHLKAGPPPSPCRVLPWVAGLARPSAPFGAGGPPELSVRWVPSCQVRCMRRRPGLQTRGDPGPRAAQRASPGGRPTQIVNGAMRRDLCAEGTGDWLARKVLGRSRWLSPWEGVAGPAGSVPPLGGPCRAARFSLRGLSPHSRVSLPRSGLPSSKR